MALFVSDLAATELTQSILCVIDFENIFFSQFQVGWDYICIQDSARRNRRNQGIVLLLSFNTLECFVGENTQLVTRKRQTLFCALKCTKYVWSSFYTLTNKY